LGIPNGGRKRKISAFDGLANFAKKGARLEKKRNQRRRRSLAGKGGKESFFEGGNRCHAGKLFPILVKGGGQKVTSEIKSLGSTRKEKGTGGGRAIK